jgi:hypothetical protein
MDSSQVCDWQHKCSGSLTGSHLFDENGVCNYCAIDREEIRAFLPEESFEISEIDTETAIRDYFRKKVVAE